MAQTTRAPIITVMGHVDHGKTTLLDYIRQTNVQAGEAGGITQHIGAYQIEFNQRQLTFIDTPGHAAFNQMRRRGAQVTDMVILVVSAKDGVQPQTVESINYIKEAEVPFVVALNKMDLDGAQPDQVKAQLAEHEVVVQEYGGDIDTVEISAKTGQGVDKLLDTVTILADLLELAADPQAALQAVVIESAKDQYKGPIARVIVQQGTLKLRQELMVQPTAANQHKQPQVEQDIIQGRVKSLINEQGQRLKQVLPGQPAEVLGLNQVPEVGTILRDADEQYPELDQQPAETSPDQADAWANLDIAALMGEKEKLNLIVKADVKGTLEAITQTIDEETIELVRAEVGELTESDLEMAEATQSLVVVFGQSVSRSMQELAQQLGVRVKQYDIIYHLLEDLEAKMMQLMDPHYDEVELGRAKIQQIFEIDGRRIAGIKVITGEINRHDRLHLERNGEYVAQPVIASLQHGKDEIETVRAKNEAGLAFKNQHLDFQKGDIIVAYKKEADSVA
jgi:translation initiation factor IF-2